MKKLFVTMLAVLFSFSSAHAQVNGGFEGPKASETQLSTVQEAMAMEDDANVVLQGKIINSLGDEKYTFKDASGEIVVEIDDEDFNGVKVTPEDTLEIVGEVDKDLNEPVQIDVKSFSVK